MRLPLLADKKKCTACTVCVDTCKHQALSSYIDDDGHYYVKLDQEACISCHACEKACPVINGMNYSESENANFYAAWNKNDEERKQSASGGVFAAMAHYILDQGGVVIGAAAENICNVRHVAIKTVDDLHQLQGSKYTQSSTEGIYKETFQYLKEGKLVLFSGTGCQVAGLLSFLKGKKYIGELTTVDLICGGVPSMLLLQKFVEDEPYKVKRIISYRTKEKGWKPTGFVYNMKVEDEEGFIHDYTGKKNLVTTGFGTEMTARYSCYDCKFVGKQRMSDFTIGDLWGDTEFPHEHHNGVSLVIAHNMEAEKLLKDMTPYLQILSCDEDNASKNNLRLVNGQSPKQYLLERKYLEFFFSRCSYKVLKKIYANDYKNYSLWMGLKILRKIYLTVLKIFMR